ncbi:Nn.00g051860.m01.CDS01 [Neocucurbitaria sp. VM-36]
MQQGSILPFLQKAKPSRAESSRPGQPYQSRPNSSKFHSKPNSTGQHRGPNRRRNTDLKATADETKAVLPGTLSSIPDFDAAESSVHNLKDVVALSPSECPGFVLPHGDADAGKKGTRIRIFDMDTFDVALQLAPNYKVYTHLGLPKPGITNTSNDEEPMGEEFTGHQSENDSVVKCDFDLADGNVEQEEAGLGNGVTTKHEYGDTLMEDAGVYDTMIKSQDETTVDPDRDSTTETDDDQVPKPIEVTTANSAAAGSTKHNTIPTTLNGRTAKPVAVLNLASERSPGGGWQNGALAQEECLCYRSSLYLSLHKTYYPLPSLSAIYTPSVLLIRDAMSRGHSLLTPNEHPTNLPVISVISVAALRKPQLADDKKHFKNEGQRAETKRKIRITLRVAAHKGHTKLVLGALGCGVFGNPPKEVAECFLEVLREKEFQGGWWEEVGFAVLDNVKGPRGGKDGEGNFGVFYRVLDGQVV